MFDPALDMSMRTALSAPALWVAITDPAHLAAWWPDAAIDARVGGAIDVGELPYKKRRTRRATGRIDEAEAGERLGFSWRTKGRDATTRVEIHVSQAKKKSKIRVVETGFDRHDYSAVEVERMRDFWRDRLTALDAYVERPKHAEALERAGRRAS